jgi:hypothetical protein
MHTEPLSIGERGNHITLLSDGSVTTREIHRQPSITAQFDRLKPSVFGRCIETPCSVTR